MDLSERSVAIKIKICHLVEKLMQHHMQLNFKSEVQFRNQVAECLAKWMRGVVFISADASHLESLQKYVLEELWNVGGACLHLCRMNVSLLSKQVSIHLVVL